MVVYPVHLDCSETGSTAGGIVETTYPCLHKVLSVQAPTSTFGQVWCFFLKKRSEQKWFPRKGPFLKVDDYLGKENRSVAG